MNVWVTAIVNEFFRKEFVKQKAEWNMIEEKALQWLKTEDLEGKDVIKKHRVFFYPDLFTMSSIFVITSY